MGGLKLKEFNRALGPKDEVIREGLKTVRKIAQRYRPICYAKGIDIEDLISEGTIGLLLAYDRFDPQRRGVNFISYAYPYIKGHMVDFIQEKSPIIRLPQNLGRIVYHIFKSNLDGQSRNQVAEHLGISLEKAAEVTELSRLQTIKSLNQPVISSFDESGSELMDFIKSHDDLSEIFVTQFMNTLNPKEQEALSLLMQGFREYEIARRMSIFREEVAEIVQELQKKVALHFGIERGSEGEGLQKKFNVTREQYMDLRAKGFTDARIAERFGMGDSALYKRKKTWGLVESKVTKKEKAERSATSSEINQEAGILRSKLADVEMKLSQLESENRLLWDMVKLLKGV